MKQTILITLLLAGLIAGLIYLGGYVLLIGLGTIILTGIILLSFLAGLKVAHKLMSEGAQLAIDSASRNDKHEAVKIQALAGLTREAMKAKQESYPALPPLSAGNFLIEGLESEEIE